MLILGFVLSNDMKAEASWAMIGLTCRLAQALGLHRGPNEGGRSAQSAADDFPRRRLWYVCLSTWPKVTSNKGLGGLLSGKTAFSHFHLIDHQSPL